MSEDNPGSSDLDSAVGLIVLGVVLYVIYLSWDVVSYYYRPDIYRYMVQEEDGLISTVLAVLLSRSKELLIFFGMGVVGVYLSGRGGDDAMGRCGSCLFVIAIFGFFANRAYHTTVEGYTACRNAGRSYCNRTDMLDMVLVGGMGASAAIGLLIIAYAVVFNR